MVSITVSYNIRDCICDTNLITVILPIIQSALQSVSDNTHCIFKSITDYITVILPSKTVSIPVIYNITDCILIYY